MYGLKTAIRIETERDRQELIPFFEAIKSDCNLVKNFEKDEIEVCEIWGIFNGMLEYLGNSYNDVKNLSDYTIIQGIPENWREEMGIYPKSVINEIATNSTFADPLSEHEAIHLSKVRDLQSKINQLESENNKLREIISDYIDLSDLYCNISETNYSIQLENLTTQAKQLLK